MARIAIIDDYQDVALKLADWGSLPDACNVTVFNTVFGDESEAARALDGFDVIVAMRERTPFTRNLIERLPKLRLLVTTGMRNLAINGDAARERGVVVSGTRLLPYPAAEHAWALILALVKRIPWEDSAMKAGGWQHAVSGTLAGRTLAILGLGKLGSHMALIGRAFGMKVIAWSQNLTDARCREIGASLVEKDELLRRADILTIHLVLSERTRGLVSSRELRLMKRSAYLVNTSRGPLVDQAALVEALTEGRIAGAGLDVFENEPLPASNPLRSLHNVVLTGHTGYVARENLELAYGDAVEDITAWLNNAPVRIVVPEGLARDGG